MPDDIVASINKNTAVFEKTVGTLQQRLAESNAQLGIVEAQRDIAEAHAKKIQETASAEIQKAYAAGYQAGANSINPIGGATIAEQNSVNPEGGTAITDQSDKIRVLSPQN